MVTLNNMLYRHRPAMRTESLILIVWYSFPFISGSHLKMGKSRRSSGWTQAEINATLKKHTPYDTWK